MRPQTRTLFGILFGLPLLIIIPLAFLGAALWRSGTIEIHVAEKGRCGETVDVYAPAAILPLVAHLTPACSMASCRMDPEARRAIRTAAVMLDAMNDAPDGVYVDVRTRDEIVHVEKKRGALEVDVDTPEDTVHASVPLGAVQSVLRAI